MLALLKLRGYLGESGTLFQVIKQRHVLYCDKVLRQIADSMALRHIYRAVVIRFSGKHAEQRCFPGSVFPYKADSALGCYKPIYTGKHRLLPKIYFKIFDFYHSELFPPSNAVFILYVEYAPNETCGKNGDNTSFTPDIILNDFKTDC